MLTNGIVTFIRISKSGEYSYRCYDAMYQGKGGFTAVTKRGAKSDASAVIYVPDIDADIAVGDYIARGEHHTDGDALTRGGLRITAITRHDYGGADMQHLRLEVK